MSAMIDLCLRHIYVAAKNQNVLFGDSYTIVVGTREVKLNFTSRKIVVMKDVMYTLEMTKNLISCYLLNKVGFTHHRGWFNCIPLQRIIILWGRVMLLIECLNWILKWIKLFLLTCYVLLMFDILGCHVNKRIIKNMSNLKLIPKLSINDFGNWKFCSQAKITKALYRWIIREIKTLDLIYCDICKFDEVLTTKNGNNILSLLLVVALISHMYI